jgi:hypothetical protein
MATRDQVINKLKEAGYAFKRDAWRVGIFKKVGGTHRIEVPKRDILSEEWVRSAFRQAGMPKEEIDEFLRHCRPS